MKIKVAFVVVLISAIAAVAILWTRVRSLEASVDQLTARLLAVPSIRPAIIQIPDNDQTTDGKKSPFKLIEASNVGVPWSVEHAMIGDGIQRTRAKQLQR